MVGVNLGTLASISTVQIGRFGTSQCGDHLDESGQPQPLPSQAKFNVDQAQQLEDGSWMVKQTELNGLKLYLKTIADELSLQITPRSEEGNSVVLGEPTQLIVAANAEVQTPMLNIRKALMGDEDQPIPLLLDSKGVIDAFLQGNGAGQSLELELTDLPKDSRCWKRRVIQVNRAFRTSYLPRHNDDGELTHSLPCRTTNGATFIGEHRPMATAPSTSRCRPSVWETTAKPSAATSSQCRW